MKSIRKNNVVIYGVAIAFAFLFSAIILLYNTNAKFRASLDDAKLRSEALLSEKLSLEKQIEQFKNDISSLTGKNKDLDKLLHNANQKVREKEAQLNNIVRENKKVKDLEAQLQALQNLKDELQKERDLLAKNLQGIKTENQQLMDQIAALNQKNQSLEGNMKLLQALNADNFRVESLKGKKGKLTVNSRRASKLNMSFDVPQNVAERINFVITTPAGKSIHSDDKHVTMRVIEDESQLNLTASLSPNSDHFEVSKRIEVSYKPKEKLSSGIYKIEIFNGEKYLGSCQLKLK